MAVNWDIHSGRKGVIARIVRRIAGVHVVALVEYFHDNGNAVLIDPGWSGLRVHMGGKDGLINWIRREAEVLDETTVQVPDVSYDYPWFEPMTCVTVVKRIVGVNKLWVITPKQLFKEIRSWEKAR